MFKVDGWRCLRWTYRPPVWWRWWCWTADFLPEQNKPSGIWSRWWLLPGWWTHVWRWSYWRPPAALHCLALRRSKVRGQSIDWLTDWLIGSHSPTSQSETSIHPNYKWNVNPETINLNQSHLFLYWLISPCHAWSNLASSRLVFINLDLLLLISSRIA